MSNFFEQLKQKTIPAQQSMLDVPIFEACMRGDINLQMYTRFLTQAYHHVKHTVPLLMACGSKLPQDKEWLREAIAEYIDEENRGIQQLADKRMKVENEADEVATIINNLRDKLSGIDTIVGDEGNRVKQIKESRDSVEN